MKLFAEAYLIYQVSHFCNYVHRGYNYCNYVGANKSICTSISICNHKNLGKTKNIFSRILVIMTCIKKLNSVHVICLDVYIYFLYIPWCKINIRYLEQNKKYSHFLFSVHTCKLDHPTFLNLYKSSSTSLVNIRIGFA